MSGRTVGEPRVRAGATRGRAVVGAKATGGQVMLTMADVDGGNGEENFDPKFLGEAREVCEQRVGDGELTYIKGCKTTAACTILLRGANSFMLDEMDRSLHDSLMVVKRILESNTLCVGGGCVGAGRLVPFSWG